MREPGSPVRHAHQPSRPSHRLLRPPVVPHRRGGIRVPHEPLHERHVYPVDSDRLRDMARRTNRLWQCQHCGRAFANTNQSHFCSNVRLEEHFAGKPEATRELFDAFLKAVRAHGPVRVLPEKTRIAFQVRMSFAALMTRRGYLRGHLVLAERHDDRAFHSIQTISPRNHVHAFELRDASQVETLEPFIAMAYRVGRQDHLPG